MRRISFAVLTAALGIPALSMGASFSSIAPGFYASGVTDGGQVAGYYNGGEYGYWTASGGLQLVGGVQDGGQATISRDGRYLGGVATNPATGLNEAARYDRVTST
jgi:hypothetical protein